ncbi:MAG: response regulator transcription factor [Saprospiraceae bacterium]|nr:response regulator transcription factor [Saprospiraceae bacterium]MBK7738253.1 response regulator transcription factor [Saprospiraceae bacterium]MBK7913173.1 response regulator transcription factor [Saprospiraceae bacterium]
MEFAGALYLPWILCKMLIIYSLWKNMLLKKPQESIPIWIKLNTFTFNMPYKIKYIIADDDDLFRTLTLEYLKLIPDLECIGEYKDGLTAITGIQNSHPDLLISDVEMPNLNGMQLVKSINQLPLVIFISSHKQYAVDAFEVDAVDFLTKPIQVERLMKAIDKVRNLLELKRNIPNQEGFKIENGDCFFIREKNAFVRINFSDVNYIESLADFVSIYLLDGSKKTALVSLKNLELQLPGSSFIRISRTHIVNTHKISSLDPTTMSLGKIRLLIGKTYSEAVLQSVLGNAAIKRFL